MYAMMRHQCRVCTTLAIVGLLWLGRDVPITVGQIAIDPRVNPRVDSGIRQDGRLFDRNTLVGSGDRNYSRPVSPLLRGNITASGTASRGLSLRSVSPISDPMSFRGPLGSSSLYSFRRDSVSVANTPLGTSSFVRPYYDVSRTAPTTGFLRGQGTAGFDPIGQPAPRLSRPDMRIDPYEGLRSQITGYRPTGPPVPSGVQSSIFGATPALPRAEDPRAAWARSQVERAEEQQPDPLRDLAARRLLFSPTQSETLQRLATPLPERLRENSWRRPAIIERRGTRSGPGLIAPPRVAAEDMPSKRDAESTTGLPSASVPPIRDPSLMPGYDAFTDMRLALTLASNPAAPMFDEMQEALEKDPQLAAKLDDQAAADIEQFLKKMLNTPMRTLSGPGASAVNRMVREAELLLDEGRFREAASRFEAAHLADPTNPLPLIGKGHALLAAGDYRSAADDLLRGLQLFPDIARFRIDLTSLMGGGEIVDIRRADIMKRLDKNEVPQLRFLLGYIEYHTGDRERGLKNLERAANDPRASSFIMRYPDLLRGNDETSDAPSSEAPLKLPD